MALDKRNKSYMFVTLSISKEINAISICWQETMSAVFPTLCGKVQKSLLTTRSLNGSLEYHPTNHKAMVLCDIDSFPGPILFDFFHRTGVLFSQLVVSFALQQT
jgi:hypothetical protein